MEPSGSLWPNGEFSIGYSPCGGKERELTPEEYAERWDDPLGLALASNSHKGCDNGPRSIDKSCEKAKPPRGTGGMTSNGKRLVRNSVEMLERAYGEGNLSFLTLTLPKLEYEEYWNVSSNWAEVVRVFYQSLGRLLGNRLLPPFYAGVTELQPKRSREEGVPALHIHAVFVGRRRNEKNWRIRPAELRVLWKRSVERFLFGEYDFSFCENIQGIRHTAAGYLSKYMAKPQCDTSVICREGTGWSLPTAWYNISLKLKRKVREKVRTDCRLIESMEVAARAGILQEYCDYYYEGIIEEMPGAGPHYFVGKLSEEGRIELIEVWRALVGVP